MNEDKRLTAFGCQNGYVQFAVVDISNEPSKWIGLFVVIIEF